MARNGSTAVDGCGTVPGSSSGWADARICVRTGPGHYTATTRLFAPAGVVPRLERAKHAEQLVAQFAAALEEGCYETPCQWFNFFEFWRD